LKSDVTTEELSDFFAELYSLRLAEISEKEALQIMAESQDKKNYQQFLTRLVSTSQLTQGLEQFPSIVPAYIIELLSQAKKSNREIEVLNAIAEHLKELSLTDSNGVSYRQRLVDCLLYPAFILFIGFILASLILIFVIPVFEDMFLSFGSMLPALTQTFIDVSHYAEPFLGFLLIFALVTTVYFKSPYSIGFKSKLFLQLPMIGKITRAIESEAIVKTLHLLCSYDFNFANALQLSSGASKNTVIVSIVTKAAEQVAKGGRLEDSLQSTQLFSPHTLRILTVFERTQQLLLLENLARSYRKPIHRQITLAMRLINIVLLIGCWLLIGFTVIALYLPIFAIGAAVS
jgi:type II secretory pathway component PulF